MRIPVESRAGIASAKASDRTIIAVALVVCAAVVAMGAFSLLAAERIDSATWQRWSGLVGHTLDRKVGDLQRELNSFAHWDETVLRTAYFLDEDWVHRNFGKWLHDSGGHDRSYIVLDTTVAYASIDGKKVDGGQATFDDKVLLPFIYDVQQAFATTLEAALKAQGEAESGDTAEKAGEAARVQPAFRSGYARVEGRVAMVGAITVTPDYGRVISPEKTPPVALTVVFVDDDFLNTLGSELRLSGLAVSDTPPSGDRQGVPIPLRDATSKAAWLTWESDRPGTALLNALLPALLATTILLLTAAAVVLWYARRATQHLAESEAYASRLAYVDPLCGLANRAMLMRVLGDRLALVNSDYRLAVFFLDLDGFKDINDTLGHHVGDLLLAEVGGRLKGLPIPGLLASRFGGDEFVLLAPLRGRPGEVEEIGNSIIEAVRRPTSIGGQTLVVSGSVGATIAPDDSSEASELIRLADIAVYRAKADGRSVVRQFEPRMEREVRQRRDIETDLKRALVQDELMLYYQPQFSVDGRTVIGFEALVRWMHPVKGMMSPGEFVPIAEQSDLITQLDMWVLRRACTEARHWGNTRLAVNLSPVDFRMRDLASSVAAVLEQTGFPPERLEVEITENVLLGNQPHAFAALSALRNMGVRIALDDFGSGYSSLGYLRRFRVDTIKIDRSFIQNIGHTDDAAAIIDCVVRLARALAITVTAEGVETREQLRYLQSVGCHHVQGFLLASPVPLNSIDRYLEHAVRIGDRAPLPQAGV